MTTCSTGVSKKENAFDESMPVCSAVPEVEVRDACRVMHVIQRTDLSLSLTQDADAACAKACIINEKVH